MFCLFSHSCLFLITFSKNSWCTKIVQEVIYLEFCSLPWKQETCWFCFFFKGPNFRLQYSRKVTHNFLFLFEHFLLVYCTMLFRKFPKYRVHSSWWSSYIVLRHFVFYSFLFKIHISQFSSCSQQLSYSGAAGHIFLLSLNATFKLVKQDLSYEFSDVCSQALANPFFWDTPLPHG